MSARRASGTLDTYLLKVFSILMADRSVSRLVILEPPIEFPPMRFYRLWHARNRHALSHRWLRHLLG